MSEINNLEEVNTQESIDDGIPQVQFTLIVSEVIQTPVDDTLSIEGMSADAKATGEAIEEAKNELQTQMNELEDDVSNLAGIFFPVGSVCVTTSETPPTFGGALWNWQEILLPVKQGDLIDGSRSYAEKGENESSGSLHFWLRIADTEV